jgi:hypothetical protein
MFKVRGLNHPDAARRCKPHPFRKHHGSAVERALEEILEAIRMMMAMSSASVTKPDGVRSDPNPLNWIISADRLEEEVDTGAVVGALASLIGALASLIGENQSYAVLAGKLTGKNLDRVFKQGELYYPPLKEGQQALVPLSLEPGLSRGLKQSITNLLVGTFTEREIIQFRDVLFLGDFIGYLIVTTAVSISTSEGRSLVEADLFPAFELAKQYRIKLPVQDMANYVHNETGSEDAGHVVRDANERVKTGAHIAILTPADETVEEIIDQIIAFSVAAGHLTGTAGSGGGNSLRGAVSMDEWVFTSGILDQVYSLWDDVQGMIGLVQSLNSNLVDNPSSYYDHIDRLPEVKWSEAYKVGAELAGKSTFYVLDRQLQLSDKLLGQLKAFLVENFDEETLPKIRNVLYTPQSLQTMISATVLYFPLQRDIVEADVLTAFELGKKLGIYIDVDAIGELLALENPDGDHSAVLDLLRSAKARVRNGEHLNPDTGEYVPPSGGPPPPVDPVQRAEQAANAAQGFALEALVASQAAADWQNDASDAAAEDANQAARHADDAFLASVRAHDADDQAAAEQAAVEAETEEELAAQAAALAAGRIPGCIAAGPCNLIDTGASFLDHGNLDSNSNPHVMIKLRGSSDLTVLDAAGSGDGSTGFLYITTYQGCKDNWEAINVTDLADGVDHRDRDIGIWSHWTNDWNYKDGPDNAEPLKFAVGYRRSNGADISSTAYWSPGIGFSYTEPESCL